MLRITAQTNDPTGILLVVQGRLAGPWVEELETALANAIGAVSGLVSLDLSAVGFVDEQGIELLLRMRDHGVVFHAVSPFIHELLEMKP